jgi:hypothetical protein
MGEARRADTLPQRLGSRIVNALDGPSHQNRNQQGTANGAGNSQESSEDHGEPKEDRRQSEQDPA